MKDKHLKCDKCKKFNKNQVKVRFSIKKENGDFYKCKRTYCHDCFESRKEDIFEIDKILKGKK
ncbi:MAG: hypothetical protein Q4P17_04065 [Methanobacterium sp.]|nr:hypothetical protein [Methanobacterium sp.]